MAESTSERIGEVTSVRNLTHDEDQPRSFEFHLFGRIRQKAFGGEDHPGRCTSLSDMNSGELLRHHSLGTALNQCESDAAKMVRRSEEPLLAGHEESRFIEGLERAAETPALQKIYVADGHKPEWTMQRVE